MAEKQPDPNVTRPKTRASERAKSNISRRTSKPEEKAEESGETGYSSAQHSSDLLSGPEATSESAAWTSEDHGSAKVQEAQESSSTMKKAQKKIKSSKKPAGSTESDSKPGDKSPEKATRLRSHKKSTPAKQTEEASAEGSQKSETIPAEQATTPPKAEVGAAHPKKGKSPNKNIFQRLRSSRKKSVSPTSTPSKHEVAGSSKKKGSKRTEETTSPPSGTTGSTKTDRPEDSAELEKPAGSPSPQKRRGLFKLGKSKSPGKQKSKSTQKSSSETADAGSKLKDEKSPKKKSKGASAKAKSPAKPDDQGSKTSPVESRRPSGVKESLVETCELVSSGIQSIQLTRTVSDRDLLLAADETMDTSPAAPGAGERTSSENTGAESAAELRRKAWRPQHSHQTGGFQHDVIWATFSSSVEDTGTEMSTVSDSSAIQGGSESKKVGSSSSDTLSSISGLKEEGATGEIVLAEKSPLQGHKRIMGKENSDSDEDAKAYRDACGSPIKKMAPQRKSPEDSSDY